MHLDWSLECWILSRTFIHPRLVKCKWSFFTTLVDKWQTKRTVLAMGEKNRYIKSSIWSGMVTKHSSGKTTTTISRLRLSKYVCLNCWQHLYCALLGSQWGWLPYDLTSADVVPYVCEVPIRDTYSITDNYRSIGKNLSECIWMCFS